MRKIYNIYTFYSWFKKFLHKHVGENVDNVFALFCKTQPDKYIGGEFNPREEFLYVFSGSSERKYIDPGMFYGYGKFYLDKNKNICFTPWNKIHLKNHPDLVLSEDSEIIYKVNLDLISKILKYSELKEILRQSLGNIDFLDLCDNKTGIIQSKIYKKLQKTESNIQQFLYINRNKDIYSNFYYYHFRRGRLIYTVHNKKVLKYGEPGYTREVWERKDKKKKNTREYLKEKEKYNSHLLGYIEAERKRKEEEENNIKIIKHGFSKTESFRGEEYHGQKRKKRK